MRILIPTVDFPPLEGDISDLSLHVARALSRQGNEVTVLAPNFPETDSFDAAEPYTVRRFPGHEVPCLRLLSLLRVGWRHARTADLILAINVAYGGVLGRAAQMCHGRPYVTIGYGYDFLPFKRKRVARLALLYLFRHGSETIAISRYAQAQLAAFGVSYRKIRVILPGADIPEPVPPAAITAARFQFDLDDTPFILAVGRLTPRNGQLDLVEAVALLQERGVHVHAVLAGRGPARRACPQKAAALGIEGSVHCPGTVSKDTLRALYQDCACFALPAGEDGDGRMDGFGLAFMEAHACGKPVVAGRSGGTMDVVLHEETGLLVPPHNAGKLADALQRILGDPTLAEAFGSAGKARVAAELNWDDFARRLVRDRADSKNTNDL